jgi:hypothetical protein
MSHKTVEQVKELIISDLSLVEKAHLIEWIGTDLRQTLALGVPAQPDHGVIPVDRDEEAAHSHVTNGFTSHRMKDVGDDQNELFWEERPWTEAELRELMRPDPKSGAEIAAMIESGEVDTSVWAAMEIPDVVEWIKNLRQQERIQRGLEDND